jgi:hypothetical protein
VVVVVTVLTKRLELGFIREGHPLFTALVDTRLAFHSGCVAKVHGSRHPLPPLFFWTGSHCSIEAGTETCWAILLAQAFNWSQRSLLRCMFCTIFQDATVQTVLNETVPVW